MTEPSHKSELHTQLLFGDYVKSVGEQVGLWLPIHLVYDGTTGWVLFAQLTFLPENIDQSAHGVLEKDGLLSLSEGKIIQVLSSSILPMNYSNQLDVKLQAFSKEQFNTKQIEAIVFPYLNSSYVWGGVTTLGIDCSGLSKILYRHFSFYLPSVAAIQINFGEVVDFLLSVQPGDLAFFENESGEINHVGIMLNPSEIIHASETNGVVAIDNMDQEGIYNRRLKKRTHKLTIIKRLIFN